MTADAGPRCGATINGPRLAGHRVVAWRHYCRNRVRNEGDHCQWHRCDAQAPIGGWRCSLPPWHARSLYPDPHRDGSRRHSWPSVTDRRAVLPPPR